MNMNKTPSFNALALCFLLTPGLAAAGNYGPDQDALQESRKKAEVNGIFGGAVVGGVLGGPPGAIVFAIVGGLISNNHSSHLEIKANENSLDQLENLYTSLEQDNQQLQLAFSELERNSLDQAQLAAGQTGACCFDTELVLHFKTNSSDIEPHYREELQRFAALVRANPDAIIQMTGFADKRGESESNLSLSRQRLGAVESVLGQLGLQADMLQSTAFGESRPLSGDENPEGMFFERRVVLKAMSPGNEYLTHIPD